MQNKQDNIFIKMMICLAVLCIAGAVAFLAWNKWKNSSSLAFSNLADEIGNVNKITIKSINGEVILYIKNGTWLIAGDEYPANHKRIQNMLHDFVALELDTPGTSDPDMYHMVGLDEDNALYVSLYDTDGMEIIGIHVGFHSNQGHGVYVRKKNDKTTWLTSDAFSVSPFIKHWIYPSVFSMDIFDIKRIDVRYSDNAGYTAEIHKYEDTRFLLTREDDKIYEKGVSTSIIEQGIIQDAVSVIEDLRTEDVVSTEMVYADFDDKNVIVAQYTTFQGEIYELRIIRVGEDDYWMKFLVNTMNLSSGQSDNNNAKLNTRYRKYVSGIDYSDWIYKIRQDDVRKIVNHPISRGNRLRLPGEVIPSS